MTDLRTYMALLTLYENNFRVLHWRLAGTGFQTAHERFGGYYDTLGEFLDQTAEQMMTISATPIAMKDALALLEEVEVDAKIISTALDISEATADKWAKEMFDQLHEIALEFANNTNMPADVCDVFMDQARYFRIESGYKLARAVTTPTDISSISSQPAATAE